MKYSIRVVTNEEQFSALREAWDAVVSEAVDANTSLTHSWLYSWWVAYRPRAQLQIVVAEQGGRVYGIAPMMTLREGGADRVLRRLRFIGDGTSETDHMNFIVRADDRQAILSVLLDAIEALRWDIAYFSQMPESSENTLQLLERAAQRGWMVDTRTVPCPRRAMPPTYDDLLRSLPSRLRTSVRSARRDLEANHKVEFGLYSRSKEIPEALATLYRNHAGRWRAKGEQGVFVDDRKRAFYSALSSRLLEDGSLRFFYLRVDGQVVAQQFCFEHAGIVMLLQEGFDFDWAEQNVGNVLRAMVLEYLIASGSSVYDFLAGTSRHKQSWSDSALNDLGIRAFRPSITGRLAFNLAHWRMRMSRRVARKAVVSD